MRLLQHYNSVYHVLHVCLFSHNAGNKKPKIGLHALVILDSLCICSRLTLTAMASSYLRMLCAYSWTFSFRDSLSSAARRSSSWTAWFSWRVMVEMQINFLLQKQIVIYRTSWWEVNKIHRNCDISPDVTSIQLALLPDCCILSITLPYCKQPKVEWDLETRLCIVTGGGIVHWEPVHCPPVHQDTFLLCMIS